MWLFLLALSLDLSFAAVAAAGDYASEISAYRRANGLPAVKADSHLAAVALKQAQAMASTGSITHSVGGNFSSRVAPLRKSRAAENIGAGFLTFSEMLKQWEDSPRPSRKSSDGRRAPRRRRLGGESEIAVPEVLGDGDHGLGRGDFSTGRPGERRDDEISFAWPCSVTS